MAVVTTKSLSIVNADATPIVATSIGEGAPGFLKSVNDSLTAVVGDSIASLYKVVRIPTNAKIKQVLLNYPTASTAGAADIDVFFSDSATDGTQPSLAGGVVQITGPVDNKLFGAAVTLTGVFTQKDVTFQNPTVFLLNHMNLPLWQVLVNIGATQFSADPGGYFDIGLKLTTALTVTAGLVGMQVTYVE
jgi:hypothetical protein